MYANWYKVQQWLYAISKRKRNGVYEYRYLAYLKMHNVLKEMNS